MTIDVYPFASAVASHLSDLRQCTWAAQRPPEDRGHYVHVRRFDGASLVFICYPLAPERVEVKAEWPKDAEPYHVVSRIRGGKERATNERLHVGCTVARRREPKAVAKEIDRRIFRSGEFDAHWSRAARKQAAVDQRDREDAAFIEALVTAGGRRNTRASYRGSDEYAVVGDLVVTPRAGGMCEVRGSIPRALMVRIAGELIAKEGEAE